VPSGGETPPGCAEIRQEPSEGEEESSSMKAKKRDQIKAKIWDPKRPPLQASIERLERIRHYRQQNPDARPRGWPAKQRWMQNA
jgi:hypothetical protein